MISKLAYRSKTAQISDSVKYMKRAICRTLLEGLYIYVSNKKKQKGKYLLAKASHL